MTSPILDPRLWFRVGRGRLRELPELSADAVTKVIGDGLPPEYGPYVLVAHELVLAEHRHVSQSRIVQVDELGACIDRGIWQYFVVSTSLSPALLARLPDLDVPTLAVNGAINLQIGRPGRLGVDQPSLGLVAKVATSAGESREHVEYMTIFDTAARQLRKQG